MVYENTTLIYYSYNDIIFRGKCDNENSKQEVMYPNEYFFQYRTDASMLIWCNIFCYAIKSIACEYKNIIEQFILLYGLVFCICSAWNIVIMNAIFTLPVWLPLPAIQCYTVLLAGIMCYVILFSILYIGRVLYYHFLCLYLQHIISAFYLLLCI